MILNIYNCREIISELKYEKDVRSNPNNHRKAQFKTGWLDAVIHQQIYSLSTLKRLTWRNLGYRMGQKMGEKSIEEINKNFNIFAQEYELNISPEDLLIETIKKAPSQEWIEQYLDLARELLEFIGVTEDDSRLSVSLSTNYGISININARRTLESNKDGKPKLRFLLPYDVQDLNILLNKATMTNKFDPRYKEEKDSKKTPYLLQFEGLPKNILTLEQQKAWKEAVLIELKSGKSSSYRKSHNSIAYKVIVDLEYRAFILKKVFSLEQEYLTTNNTIIFANEIDSTEIFIEGAVHQIKVNAYERDAKARQKCIEHYGCSCYVCRYDFGQVFGEIGQGFIHVHHLKPLSEIAEEYVVDPVKDLRPVCPNCHSIIHRRSPPFSIEEIKKLFNNDKHHD